MSGQLYFSLEGRFFEIEYPIEIYEFGEVFTIKSTQEEMIAKVRYLLSFESQPKLAIRIWYHRENNGFTYVQSIQIPVKEISPGEGAEDLTCDYEDAPFRPTFIK